MRKRVKGETEKEEEGGEGREENRNVLFCRSSEVLCSLNTAFILPVTNRGALEGQFNY